MDLHPGLGSLSIEEAQTTRLVAREIVVDNAPGRQAEGIIGTGLLCWRLILNWEHLRFAVGMTKTLGVEARCPWVIQRRTGPEDALLLVDLLPGYPVIISHSTF